MLEPIEAETICLAFNVLSVDPAAGTAKVQFLNPAHLGGPLTVKTRLVPNPAWTEGGEEPETIEETFEVDEDANPHQVKDVRVPLDAAGQVDDAAWTQRLVEQARGVKARMDAALAPLPAEGALDGLVGAGG